MNTALISSIAQYLEVSPNQVAKVTELHWVWCVVIVGRRPRFVSKKAVSVESIEDELLAEYLMGCDDSDAERAEDLEAQLSMYECISEGSQKQKRWASYIFASACRSLSRQIVNGSVSENNAIEILSNKDASWWIDNRREFE
ncbi:MAG: hypothetical protein AAGD25_06680 [Cyanobacteria bacterium P01_F01_bin.150]